VRLEAANQTVARVARSLGPRIRGPIVRAQILVVAETSVAAGLAELSVHEHARRNRDAHAGFRVLVGLHVVRAIAGAGIFGSRGTTVARVARSAERHRTLEYPIAGVGQVAAGAVAWAALADLPDAVQTALSGLRIELGAEERLRLEMLENAVSIEGPAALLIIRKGRICAAGCQDAAHPLGCISSHQRFG